jgi:hypothetical protein
LFTQICHCTLCQKRTGSAFFLNIMVFEGDFALIKGATDNYSTLTGNGLDLLTFACPSCHKVVYHTHPEYQRIIMIAGGTVNDASWLKPQAHIYTNSKQAWVELSDDIPAYREMYELEEAWPPASLVKLTES